MGYAKVIIGLSHPEVDKLFDYRIPAELEASARPGVRVIVPFGARGTRTEGYIISLCETTELPEGRLKDIREILDSGKPVFTPELLALAEWLRERCFCTLNQCLQIMLPPGIRTKSVWLVSLKEGADESGLTERECTFMELLRERGTLALSEIEPESGAKAQEIARSLEKKGLITLRQSLRRSDYKIEKKYYSLNIDSPLLGEIRQKAQKDRRLEGQRRILEHLADGREAAPEELRELAGASPLKTLLSKGVLLERRQEEKRRVLPEKPYTRTEAFSPTKEQAAALAALREEMQQEKKRPVLLHGVTGSGKTEIYLQMIADVLEMGKQAVVLVPEIALTPLILERFLSRFGEKVSVTHSRLSTGERVDQWKRARDGEISVIIGPRSALFLPFADIGAIIIDEAHETSYLSDVTPKYDAREAAEKLAELHGALLLMGTATPDISAYYKATQGEYRLLELKERTGGGSRPEIFVTDMRQELAEGNRSVFGRPLRKALAETLERGEQAMLFLNRRGYATFVSCRSCGHAMVCPECDLPYTYHATENILLCHTCGRREASPRVCPECGSGYIRQFGTGTEKIEEETRRFFPNARILRMDLDTTAKKHSHERILAAFSQKEADILIGTQMIAKGHDFASITLVGIMAADTSLNTDSYTAAETGFRLMLQAAGRTGRAGLPGRVYLQTYQPEHYAVRYAAAQDFHGFYAEEIEMRRMMGYPPFSAFFSILLTGESKAEAAAAAERLAARLAQADGEGLFQILGPVPAALAQLRGEYRFRILVKGAEEQPLREFVLPAVEEMRHDRKSGVRFQLTLNHADF
ncbi:MAG: primosomal protein N' [Anaerotignum sp.]|nr:primosomal protein N' [Anaerotignum sp.]